MSLTFYTAPMSTAGITEAVIAELGIPCERIELNLKAGDSSKPEFLKVNPNGLVPAIVHDGTPIWESSAITMYLGELYGVDAKLYPAPGPKRGEAMKWITWSNVTLAEAAMRFAYSQPENPEVKSDLNSTEKAAKEQQRIKVLSTATSDLAGHLKILDSALAGRSFLLGNEYSLADTHMAGIVGWLEMMHVELDVFQNVKKWMKLCFVRPAFANMM